MKNFEKKSCSLPLVPLFPILPSFPLSLSSSTLPLSLYLPSTHHLNRSQSLSFLIRPRLLPKKELVQRMSELKNLIQTTSNLRRKTSRKSLFCAKCLVCLSPLSILFFSSPPLQSHSTFETQYSYSYPINIVTQYHSEKDPIWIRSCKARNHGNLTP